MAHNLDRNQFLKFSRYQSIGQLCNLCNYPQIGLLNNQYAYKLGTHRNIHLSLKAHFHKNPIRKIHHFHVCNRRTNLCKIRIGLKLENTNPVCINLYFHWGDSTDRIQYNTHSRHNTHYFHNRSLHFLLRIFCRSGPDDNQDHIKNTLHWFKVFKDCCKNLSCTLSH